MIHSAIDLELIQHCISKWVTFSYPGCHGMNGEKSRYFRSFGQIVNNDDKILWHLKTDCWKKKLHCYKIITKISWDILSEHLIKVKLHHTHQEQNHKRL